MSTPWTIEVAADSHSEEDGSRRYVKLQFPHRPTEAELGLALANFFGQMNFRFNEKLEEVQECALVLPPRSPIENSPD